MKELLNYLSKNPIHNLTEDLGLIVKSYPEHQLFLLDYNQINSPKNNAIADNCRGLLLREECDGSYSIVCLPFKRFFNYGECDTDKTFNWNNVIVYDKADGSMIKVWYDFKQGFWQIGTRGTAFADNLHHNVEGKTFRQLVLEALCWNEDTFQIHGSMHLDSSVTYLFEFCSPMNRVVTLYEKPHLQFLGSRSNVTYDELLYEDEFVRIQNWNSGVVKVKSFDLRNINDCLNAIKRLGDCDEGYVAHNPKTGQRVKIKNPRYVAIHHIRGNLTPTFKNFATLFLDGECEEFLTYFPEYSDEIKLIEQCMNNFDNQVNRVYDEVKDIESQKDFALEVSNEKFSGIYFKMRSSNETALNIFNTLTLNRKIEILETYKH